MLTVTHVQLLSHVQRFATPWTVGLPGSSVRGIFQARVLEWLPFPPPGDFTDPGIEPMSLASPALAPLAPPGNSN